MRTCGNFSNDIYAHTAQESARRRNESGELAHRCTTPQFPMIHRPDTAP